MSFLDTIKDRLRGVDDYYEDDYYDEDYESDGYEQDDRRSRDAGGSGRLLGTKPRPAAEAGCWAPRRAPRPRASPSTPAPAAR